MKQEIKTKYSISAQKFWPLYTKEDGYDFDEMTRRAQALVGTEVFYLKCWNGKPPTIKQLRIVKVCRVDCMGDLYPRFIGRSSGTCDPTVEFWCVPADADGKECHTYDAADLYETAHDCDRERIRQGGVVYQSFDDTWNATVCAFAQLRRFWKEYEKWEEYFADIGGGSPIHDPAQRDFIERIRATVRTANEWKGETK